MVQIGEPLQGSEQQQQTNNKSGRTNNAFIYEKPLEKRTKKRKRKVELTKLESATEKVATMAGF